jgi:hypothetical protein
MIFDCTKYAKIIVFYFTIGVSLKSEYVYNVLF